MQRIKTIQPQKEPIKLTEDITALLRCEPDLALQQLLNDYGGLVFTVVRSILDGLPQEEIEECVSDAFLYVYEHRERLDFSKGSVKAYLCAAAKNRALDRRRQLQRTAAQQQKAKIFSDSIPSAEETVLQNTDRDALIDAITALGEPDANILICRYYLNMKSAEIGAVLGIKPNTVDQRAGRALKKLARQFRKGDAMHE